MRRDSFVLSDGGLILIDDVRNATPRRFGEGSTLGKAKYSIPYLLENGFEIVFDGYQVAMARPDGLPSRSRRRTRLPLRLGR